MAKYEITTKQEVLRRLGIADWRFLTQDHYMDLVAMLDKMDPTTKAFVQKQMAKMAAESVRTQQDATLKAIEQNGEVGKKALDVSKAAIKALDDIALSGMPEDQQDKWADRIMQVQSDAMRQADEARKSNNKGIAALTATTLFALSVATLCITGKVDLSKAAKMIRKIK